MKNKNMKMGFTLTELIVALVILVAIGLLIGVGLNRVFSTRDQESFEAFVDKVTSATDVYVSNEPSILMELHSSKGFVLITIEALIESGLLNDSLINPDTGEEVRNDETVLVSLDASGTIKFQFPAVAPPEHLQTLNKNLEFGDEFNCLDPLDLDTINLGLIDRSGNLITPYFKNPDGTVRTDRISCHENIDPTNTGSFTVTYTYLTTEGIERETTRNVIIADTIPPSISDFTDVVRTIGLVTPWLSNLTRRVVINEIGSGLARIEQCIMSTPTCTPNVSIPVGSNRHQQTVDIILPTKPYDQFICIRAIDAAGNISETKCDGPWRVDRTGPTSVSASVNGSWGLNVTGSDPESGIQRFVCRWGTSSGNLNNIVTINTNNTSATCNFGFSQTSSAQTYFARVDVYNGAGLVTSSNTVTISIPAQQQSSCEDGTCPPHPYAQCRFTCSPFQSNPSCRYSGVTACNPTGWVCSSSCWTC
jgi:hypothetical protein